VVIVLLTGIFVALVVLILVLYTQKGGRAPAPPPVGSSPAPPKPVGDAARIREMLKVGSTYRVVVKAKLMAKAEDKSWGTRRVVNLAYVAEMEADRTIEANDGHTVVERRHFGAMRNAKFLCDLEDFSIELGPSGQLVLGFLDQYTPGTGAVVVAAKSLAEAILARVAQKEIQSESAKAIAGVNGLSGKTVRITYVDGLGVQGLEPIGGPLSAAEQDFLKRVAVLSDCYILPDRASRPGDRWAVNGAQLASFLDPTLEGFPDGEVWVRRDEDLREGGKLYALLRAEDGSVEVNASDDSTRRIGRFTPRGTLKYSITDGFVEEARLVGRISFEKVSRNHILFETSFKTHPTLEVTYSCTMR
jgi:hypothetical protein